MRGSASNRSGRLRSETGYGKDWSWYYFSGVRRALCSECAGSRSERGFSEAKSEPNSQILRRVRRPRDIPGIFVPNCERHYLLGMDVGGSMLELDDIQSAVLRPRPTPYQATYVIFRIDDRKAGRELIRRLSEVVASAAHPTSPAGDTWVSTALSYKGLKALGVPRASLESVPPEFQQGMAPRANLLEDSGESSSENWEKPLGSADVHVVVTALAPDAERLEAVLKRARRAYQELPGVTAFWRQ